jgi:hypothetical protein
MIVPAADDLKQHGLLTQELLEAIVNKQVADTELCIALGNLPDWYLQRLEALAVKGGGKPACWSDTTVTATALAA